MKNVHVHNIEQPEVDWTALNFQLILTSKQTKFSITKTNNRKVGSNILANHLQILNNKIYLTELNKSITSLKVKQKGIFFSLI